MKRVLLSLLLAIVVMSSYAQTKRYYCEVQSVYNVDNKTFVVTFDFGRQIPANMWRGVEFVDEKTGKVIDFCSVVDAANYMAEKGWHFQQKHSILLMRHNM